MAAIIERAEHGELRLVRSPAHSIENDRNPREDRRLAAALWLDRAAVTVPLSDAAATCIKNGEACLQHCLDMYSMGDTTMAGCGKAVSDMLATTRALLTLQLAGSKHAKAAASLAAAAAKDCEAECKKYTHDVCKACADCCGKLVAEAAK